MRSQALRASFALLLAVAPPGLAGCWTSNTYEREVGAPRVEVERVLLPGPRRVEAAASRSGETLHLDLSRGHSCRRIEHTTVRRESVEETSLGAGTYITGGTFGGIGLITAAAADDPAAGLVLLGIGGAIFALAAPGTGTVTKPLPPAQSSERAGLEPCAAEPIANARVVVVSHGATHEGTSDEAGRVSLENVAPGPLRVLVDGRAASVREVAWKPARPKRTELAPPPKPESPPAASFPPTEAPAPPIAPPPPPTPTGSAPPAPPPPPPVKPPAPRDPYAPLPPPPPRPPGARAPGE